MSDLIENIRAAQVIAGENEFIKRLPKELIEKYKTKEPDKEKAVFIYPIWQCPCCKTIYNGKNFCECEKIKQIEFWDRRG